MTATFELAGQEFVALNGGPSFTFAQGISLSVNCETQEEIDELWEKLSAGGEKGPCGWLTRLVADQSTHPGRDAG
jgi:predicted 3-demethylubiquinone-9 3-methyltransferase (glyoxalase superfamily)